MLNPELICQILVNMLGRLEMWIDRFIVQSSNTEPPCLIYFMPRRSTSGNNLLIPKMREIYISFNNVNHPHIQLQLSVSVNV